MKLAFDHRFLKDSIREGWFEYFQQKLEGHELVLATEAARDEDVRGLICFGLFEDPLAKFPHLQHIFSLIHGVNSFVNSPFMPEKVQLYRMIDSGLTQSMREYVMSMILRIHVNHARYETDKRQKSWNQALYKPPLAPTRRVGFIGAGVLGAACARDAVYMGFPTSCWSRTHKSIQGVTSYAGPEEFDEFLAQCDIIVILAPLTPQTRNLIDMRALSRLPAGASIINVGRGPLIVDEDLLAALDSGHIDTAVLDVFRKEPLPADHPYWTHPKIFISPHISAITQMETAADHIKLVADSLEKRGDAVGKVELRRGY